jgi:hypothetical protein
MANDRPFAIVELYTPHFARVIRFGAAGTLALAAPVFSLCHYITILKIAKSPPKARQMAIKIFVIFDILTPSEMLVIFKGLGIPGPHLI